MREQLGERDHPARATLFTIEGDHDFDIGAGAGAIGTIRVSDSAVFTTGTGDGSTMSSPDLIDVTSGGRFELNGDLFMFGLVQASGGGQVVPGPGVTVLLGSAGRWRHGGSFAFGQPEPVTFDAFGGAEIRCDNACIVGAAAGTSGNVYLDGLGANGDPASLFNVALGHDLIVGDRGTGRVEVENGAMVRFGDDVLIGQNAGGDGTIVLRGAGRYDGEPVPSRLLVERNGSTRGSRSRGARARTVRSKCWTARSRT